MSYFLHCELQILTHTPHTLFLRAIVIYFIVFKRYKFLWSPKNKINVVKIDYLISEMDNNPIFR